MRCCQKLQNYNPYICATGCYRSLMFLNYEFYYEKPKFEIRFRDYRKYEFVAKIIILLPEIKYVCAEQQYAEFLSMNCIKI